VGGNLSRPHNMLAAIAPYGQFSGDEVSALPYKYRVG
jgi:hypothetical protein